MENKNGRVTAPVGKIPATPLNLIRESQDLEWGFDCGLGGEGVTERVCSPITEEDESVIVSVHDKRTVLAVFSKPLNTAVGMKDAVSEGKVRTVRIMEERLEWNGQISRRRIVLKFEGAGRPFLLFSLDEA